MNSPASTELLKLAQAALEYIDAIPKDVVLPAMPGFDRDWASDVLRQAASQRNAGDKAWRDVVKQPDERPLPTYGQIPWGQLGRDVMDAMMARRHDYEFDATYYPGHQTVTINFNSLARIVDKYRYYGLPCVTLSTAATGKK